MNLQFNGRELSAVVRLAWEMILADGKVEEIETKTLALELLRFGVDENQCPVLIAAAQSMEASEAIAIVSLLKDNEKKYVAAFLGTIMAIDRNIDDAEMKLWKFISTICRLPTMNVAQALQIMSEL